MEEWFARIGSKAAAIMEERQRQRLRGEINEPVKGPRGLAKCVQELQRRAGKITRSIPKEPPPTTVIGNGADKAPKRRKGKWEQRGSSGN